MDLCPLGDFVLSPKSIAEIHKNPNYINIPSGWDTHFSAGLLPLCCMDNRETCTMYTMYHETFNGSLSCYLVLYMWESSYTCTANMCPATINFEIWILKKWDIRFTGIWTLGHWFTMITRFCRWWISGYWTAGCRALHMHLQEDRIIQNHGIRETIGNRVFVFKMLRWS